MSYGHASYQRFYILTNAVGLLYVKYNDYPFSKIMNNFSSPQLNYQEHTLWQKALTQLNRYNLYCACRQCGYEWVDSQTDIACPHCQSKSIQMIPCWQFPDD